MTFPQFLLDFQGQFEDEGIAIDEGDKFRELDAWDSLTGMAVLYMIQHNYSVTIPVNDFMELQTPKEIFEYIKQKMN
jgi:acyl carrier protein